MKKNKNKKKDRTGGIRQGKNSRGVGGGGGIGGGIHETPSIIAMEHPLNFLPPNAGKKRCLKQRAVTPTMTPPCTTLSFVEQRTQSTHRATCRLEIPTRNLILIGSE